jgi:hypothetical protein
MTDQNQTNDELPIIDAMLAEYLANSRPKSLDAELLASKVAQSTFLSLEDVARLDAAQAAGKIDADHFAKTGFFQSAKPTATPHAVRSRSTGWRIAICAVGALAACLLIMASSMLPKTNDSSVLNSPTPRPQDLAKEIIEQQKANGNPNPIETVSPEAVPPKNQIANQDKSNRDQQPMKLPFEKDSDRDARAVASNANQATSKRSYDADTVLVTVNSQFNELWSRLGIQRPEEISFDQWASRVSIALIDRDVSSEFDASTQLDDDIAKSDFLDQLMLRQDFIDRWSSRIGQQAFGLAISSENDSEATDIIAASIHNDQPLVDQWSNLLSVNVDGDSRIGAWWVSNAELDAKQHASKLFAIASGNDSTCVQCHHANSDSVPKLSNDVESKYWSLAGLIDKFRIVDSSQIQWQVDSELFYEVDNGKMLIASAGQPSSGQSNSISNPDDVTLAMSQWAQWIEDQSKTHESYIDVVWSGLFGSRLSESLQHDAQLVELQDLREYLASASKNDASLRSLIKVIAMSKAFATPAFEESDRWYLMANDDAIADTQSKLRSYAFYTPRSASTVSTYPALTAWLRDMNRPMQTVLAQPAPPANPPSEQNVAPKTPTEVPEAQMNASQLDWLIRSKHLSADAKSWISRVAQSKLAWDDVVQHLYFKTVGRAASNEELGFAKEILDVSGQREVALSRIYATLSLQ